MAPKVRAITRTFGANLHVLHVVDDVRARAMGSEGYTIELAHVQRAVETWARDQLDWNPVHDDNRRELDATVILRTSIATASAIVSYAKETNIDLIVLGTRAAAGWRTSSWGVSLNGSFAPRPALGSDRPAPRGARPFAPDAMQAVARL